jgi:hypothetical protein
MITGKWEMGNEKQEFPHFFDLPNGRGKPCSRGVGWYELRILTTKNTKSTKGCNAKISYILCGFTP